MDLGFASRIGDYYLQALAGKSAAVKNTAAKNTVIKNGGGGITGPTEAEQRQFEEEQKAKKIRRARYAQINEEYALKRKLQEMERNKAYYQESVKALPISSVHQRRIREAINSVSHGSIGVSKANQALEWRHNGN